MGVGGGTPLVQPGGYGGSTISSPMEAWGTTPGANTFWVEKTTKTSQITLLQGKKGESTHTHSAMHCACLYIIIEVSIGIQIAVHTRKYMYKAN